MYGRANTNMWVRWGFGHIVWLEGPQKVPLAAGSDGPGAGCRLVAAGVANRPGRVLVERPRPGVWGDSRARPPVRTRRGESARQCARATGKRPFLPLGHLPLRTESVRVAGARLLALGRGWLADNGSRRQGRTDDDGGPHRRPRDQCGA